MQQHFEIAGTGHYLPGKHLSAEDVDFRASQPPGWTRRHLGVLNRHECVAPETLLSMGVAAAEQAMNDAGVDWSEIDMIIDASTSHHQPIPCNAACLQRALGERAAGIPCFDVGSTCLGFVVALNLINGLMATGAARQVLLVASEAPLLAVNWNEPESACLMGDGAAAAVVRKRAPLEDSFFFRQQTFSEYLGACELRAGSHGKPSWEWTPENEAEYRFHMDGRQLLRAVRQHLPAMCNALIQDAGVERAQLHVLPHQAAPRALALVRAMLGIAPDRFYDLAADMGNLVAASVPSVLHRCRKGGKVGPGDWVMLLGTSAGYSQAGLIFRL